MDVIDLGWFDAVIYIDDTSRSVKFEEDGGTMIFLVVAIALYKWYVSTVLWASGTRLLFNILPIVTNLIPGVDSADALRPLLLPLLPPLPLTPPPR